MIYVDQLSTLGSLQALWFTPTTLRQMLFKACKIGNSKDRVLLFWGDKTTDLSILDNLTVTCFYVLNRQPFVYSTVFVYKKKLKLLPFSADFYAHRQIFVPRALSGFIMGSNHLLSLSQLLLGKLTWSKFIWIGGDIKALYSYPAFPCIKYFRNNQHMMVHDQRMKAVHFRL